MKKEEYNAVIDGTRTDGETFFYDPDRYLYSVRELYEYLKSQYKIEQEKWELFLRGE